MAVIDSITSMDSEKINKMEKTYDLSRFINAQHEDYDTALSEIKAGRKRSHWIWYIFPQIAGLGHSSTAEYYAIKNLDEAKAYIADEYLANNMQKICEALMECKSNDPTEVMGYPDDLKLKSSMTLFAVADLENPIYKQVIEKFYGGKMDELTLKKIR